MRFGTTYIADSSSGLHDLSSSMKLWTAAEMLDEGNEGRVLQSCSLRLPQSKSNSSLSRLWPISRNHNRRDPAPHIEPTGKKRPILSPRRTCVLYSAIRPPIISTSPQTPSQRHQSHATFTTHPSPPPSALSQHTQGGAWRSYF